MTEAPATRRRQLRLRRTVYEWGFLAFSSLSILCLGYPSKTTRRCSCSTRLSNTSRSSGRPIQPARPGTKSRKVCSKCWKVCPMPRSAWPTKSNCRSSNFTAAVGLHFGYYNLVKINGTIRMTPAMKAGVVKTLWNTSDLVKAALDA